MAGNTSISAGVAGRYATALFDLAKEAGQVDHVAGELKHFVELLDDNVDLDRMVNSPAFSLDEKKRALAKVLGVVGLQDLSRNFLSLVAQNNRLFVVRDMVRAFNGLVAADKGEVEAVVTSATPLTDAQMKALADNLKSTIGQDVNIETQVAPELLGGLIIKVGSRMIDNSLRTKLNNLNVAMKEVS